MAYDGWSLATDSVEELRRKLAFSRSYSLVHATHLQHLNSGTHWHRFYAHMLAAQARFQQEVVAELERRTPLQKC